MQAHASRMLHRLHHNMCAQLNHATTHRCCHTTPLELEEPSTGALQMQADTQAAACAQQQGWLCCGCSSLRPQAGALCTARPGVGKGGRTPTTSHKPRLTATAAGLGPPPHTGASFLPSLLPPKHTTRTLVKNCTPRASQHCCTCLQVQAESQQAGRLAVRGAQASGGTAAHRYTSGHLLSLSLSLP